MKKIIKDLSAYINEVLAIHVHIQPWNKKYELPLFLGNTYEFYEMSLLKHPCLIMLPKEHIEMTPGVIKKHREQVLKKWNGLCIYSQPAISSYNRKRLIGHQVPFIIPGNQMYLPELGIVLSEYYRRNFNQLMIKTFSPAAQAVIIFAMNDKSTDKLNPSALARQLGYTQMTMTRVFNELQAANIGEIVKQGKERRWLTGRDKHELWETAKPFLTSPIMHRTWLTEMIPGYTAGLSALSNFSMLNSPSLPIIAIGSKHWSELKKTGIKEIPSPEGALIELEIWNYDPGLFAKNGIVDPFSLYLSLEHFNDERVEGAMEELLKAAE